MLVLVEQLKIGHTWSPTVLKSQSMCSIVLSLWCFAIMHLDVGCDKSSDFFHDITIDIEGNTNRGAWNRGHRTAVPSFEEDESLL